MIEQAEAVPQVAYGLLMLAAKHGDSVEISAQTKNWNDATKAAAAARKNFLELQELSRALISLDEVENVVGTTLQEIRNALLKLGATVSANLVSILPADKVQNVRMAVDDAVDLILSALEAAPDRTRRDLAS